MLLDYMAKTTGAFQNLLRVDRSGQPVWIAHLPDQSAGDSYVSVDNDCGVLVAHTWNSIRAEVNWDNGHVIRSAITK